MPRVAFTLVVLLFAADTAFGQLLWAQPGEPQPDVPEVVKLVVDPAPEPQPALRYSLLPKYGERQPGNGAPYYYRAILNLASTRGLVNGMPEEERKPLWIGESWTEWAELPLEEFPREKTKRLIETYDRVLREVRVAAYREKCDWELRFQDLEGMEAIAFILEEFQNCRELARLLVMKARLEIVEGRQDEAIRTLALAFQLGRDSSNLPILINDLIGVAVGSMARVEVEHLVASPGCPNLYWALAAIPEPFVDVRTSLQQEALLAEKIFPLLRDADTAERSDEEWNRLVRDTLEDMDRVWGMTRIGHSGGELSTSLARAANAALLAKAYPEAKARLVEAGYAVEDVEAMAVGRVIAIDAQRTYRYVRDEMFKGALLPPREGWRSMRRAEERLREEGYLGGRGGERETLPIASALLPAVTMASMAPLRFERDLRALRVVEALRMHAAKHGRFPKSLDEIDAVPVPDDPLNDAAFPYHLDGETAVLEVRAPEGFSPRNYGREYHVSLRKE